MCQKEVPSKVKKNTQKNGGFRPKQSPKIQFQKVLKIAEIAKITCHKDKKKTVKKVPKIHSRCHKVPNIPRSDKKRPKGAKKRSPKSFKKKSVFRLKKSPIFSSKKFFLKAEIAKINDSKQLQMTPIGSKWLQLA